jgi:hypothetical protein
VPENNTLNMGFLNGRTQENKKSKWHPTDQVCTLINSDEETFERM